jgi:diadenylate cyclase
MMEQVFDFISRGWRSAVEIAILAAVLYHFYLYFRGTRGAKVLTGLALIFLALILVSQLLQLVVISYIVKNLTAFLAFALVVIFQPELRRALAALGSHRFFSAVTQNREAVEIIAEAVFEMSTRQMGAIVVIERDTNIQQYAETGVRIDAELAPELLLTLFHPKTPLHDGGVIVRGDRIVAAACIFPVSQREDLDRNLGLRHRAALGVCDESDAVAVVVSEETGIVSICHRRKIERNFEPADFKKRLAELLAQAPTHDETPDSQQLEGETPLAPARGHGVVPHKKERRDEESLD